MMTIVLRAQRIGEGLGVQPERGESTSSREEWAHRQRVEHSEGVARGMASGS